MIATTMTSFLRRSGLIHLLGLAALVPALVLTASCSDDVTPTNPSGLPQVAGTWIGTYRIASCTDTLNGAPGTLCANLSSTAAVRPPLTLTLQQTDEKLVGNIVFSGWLVRSMVVTGVVQAGGAVLLEGSATFTESPCSTVTTQVPGRLTLSAWNSVVNRTSDGITGDFRLSATTRLTSCAFGEVTLQADTLQLTRQ